MVPGREVTVASNEPRTWTTLCESLGIQDLLAHRIGVDDDAPARARLTEVFQTRPSTDWLASPGLAGGVGPVNGPDDLLDDPQVVERRTVVTLPISGARVLANPIRWHSQSGIESTHGLSDPPELGADTLEALSAAGFELAEIARLRAANVVNATGS